MTYFPDLSTYTYANGYYNRPGTKNIGWLDGEHEFHTEVPTEEFLDKLWTYCSVSVAQTRGGYLCDRCKTHHSMRAERKNKSLHLGSAEIRVFSANDITIYAAPTMIYHYVSIHHYKPPDEFMGAIYETDGPPSQSYFKKLEACNLEWQETFTG